MNEVSAAIQAALNRLHQGGPLVPPSLPDYRTIVAKMCATARGLLDTESELERFRRHRRRGRLVEEALAALDELLAAGDVERTPEVAALVDDLATLWRDEPPPPRYELCPIEPTVGIIDLDAFDEHGNWREGKQPPGV
jgi:hypothetical protein